MSTPLSPTSWRAFDIGSQALPGSPGFQNILIDLGLPGTDQVSFDGDGDIIDDLVREFQEPGSIFDQAALIATNEETANGTTNENAVKVEVDGGQRRAKRKMVAEDAKDEKYKRRRAKNTVYAKRSRDRARAKRQADQLRLANLVSENEDLRARLLQLEYRLAQVQQPQSQPLLC